MGCRHCSVYPILCILPVVTSPDARVLSAAGIPSSIPSSLPVETPSVLRCVSQALPSPSSLLIYS